MGAICHDCVLPTLEIIIDCIIDNPISRMGIVTGGKEEHQSTDYILKTHRKRIPLDPSNTYRHIEYFFNNIPYQR